MKAVGDNLVVEPIAKSNESSSGLIMSDKDVFNYHTGVILACGSIQADVQTGDTIVYSKSGVVEFKSGDKDLHCVNLSSVLMAE